MGLFWIFSWDFQGNFFFMRFFKEFFKYKNWNIQMWHFDNFSNNVLLQQSMKLWMNTENRPSSSFSSSIKGMIMNQNRLYDGKNFPLTFVFFDVITEIQTSWQKRINAKNWVCRKIVNSEMTFENYFSCYFWDKLHSFFVGWIYRRLLF